MGGCEQSQLAREDGALGLAVVSSGVLHHLEMPTGDWRDGDVWSSAWRGWMA